jgi:hypothetical protein
VLWVFDLWFHRPGRYQLIHAVSPCTHKNTVNWKILELTVNCFPNSKQSCWIYINLARNLFLKKYLLINVQFFVTGVPYPAVFDLPNTWSETTFALSWKVNCSTTAPVISYRLEFRESGFTILTDLFYNSKGQSYQNYYLLIKRT